MPSTELGAGALETRNGTSLKKLVSGKVNIFVKGEKKMKKYRILLLMGIET